MEFETEHHERRKYNTDMFALLTNISGDIGQMKGDVAALAGPKGRVTMLEDAAKTADNRFWLQTVVIVPLLGIFHLVARKLGF